MSKVYDKDDVILTVDVAICVDEDEIILIERAKEPHMDKLVLPGGHVDVTDLSLPVAAERELEEELKLYVSRDQLQMLSILDGIDRDPRPGRRVSVVYYAHISKKLAEQAIASSDAKAFCIKKFSDLTEDDIGFDHWIAIDKLHQMVRRSRPIVGAYL